MGDSQVPNDKNQPRLTRSEATRQTSAGSACWASPRRRLKLHINTEPISNLPVTCEQPIFEVVHGGSGHANLLSGGGKTGKVTFVGGEPMPRHNHPIKVRQEVMNRKALIREWCTREPNALLVAGQINRLSIPRIAWIMMNRVFRRDVPIRRFDVASVPHFINESHQEIAVSYLFIHHFWYSNLKGRSNRTRPPVMSNS